jgi:hypothetical protein
MSIGAVSLASDSSGVPPSIGLLRRAVNPEEERGWDQTAETWTRGFVWTMRREH